MPDIAGLAGYAHERRHGLPGMRDALIDHFASTDAAQRISVWVVPYESPGAAHEGLAAVLETSMTVKLPSCRERGFELGDICFCSLSEPVSAVYFVRANVLVRVESTGDEPAAVTDAAAELDQGIAATLG